MKLFTLAVMLSVVANASTVANANPSGKGKSSAVASVNEKLKRGAKSKGVPTIQLADLTDVNCQIVQGDPTPKFQITNPLSTALAPETVVMLFPLDESGNATNQLSFGLSRIVAPGSTYDLQRYDISSSCMAFIWPYAVPSNELSY